ncbi:platelet-activating factor acetylhydrolase IB subunit gamma isoform X1 [Electrophorus electricus]|uniref:Platelet-activating factor acetylhydrolase IB subunit alpha1 n=2 Tax=Electrophorus TaxID=8004 RepID=A0AAY5EGX3_ELEEL|nr:platelet-activating factor acetylhydrolase IB subunit gamma isoform X1 [Electrophorus electricus]
MSSGDSNPAATPIPCEDVQGDGRWMSMHNRFVSDSKGKEPDVLFVGDSLVQLLHEFEVWRKLFSPLHTLNFGIGGDATQHVLWRLSNGELDHISPKVVVVWVGTNNHGHTPEQICGGIMAIIDVINQHLSQAHILVLGVLPRGKSPNPLRERNKRVNTLVQDKLASVCYASFLDVDPGFVHSDGSISHQDLYDYLHLTPQGYQKVCEPLYMRIKALLEMHAP